MSDMVAAKHLSVDDVSITNIQYSNNNIYNSNPKSVLTDVYHKEFELVSMSFGYSVLLDRINTRKQEK